MKTNRPVARGAEILKEPYGEDTRRHRKSLIAVSTVAIFISLTGWFPSEISAIGLKIGISDRQVIIWALVISILYFLISFINHAWPESIYKHARIYVFYDMDEEEEVSFNWRAALVSTATRTSFYITVPLLISGVALICLLWISLAPEMSNTLANWLLWIARVVALALMVYFIIVLLIFSFEGIRAITGLFKVSRIPKDKSKIKEA